MGEIILYSNHCPQCRYLESLLKQKDIQYTEVNDLELMQTKGFKSMPMLEVAGIPMVYKDALTWAQEQ